MDLELSLTIEVSDFSLLMILLAWDQPGAAAVLEICGRSSSSYRDIPDS